MSDLFHEAIPDEFINQVFSTMERANWHIYQVLTKRPGRMRRYMDRRYGTTPMPDPQAWGGGGASPDNGRRVGGAGIEPVTPAV